MDENTKKQIFGLLEQMTELNDQIFGLLSGGTEVPAKPRLQGTASASGVMSQDDARFVLHELDARGFELSTWETEFVASALEWEGDLTYKRRSDGGAGGQLGVIMKLRDKFNICISRETTEEEVPF